MILKNWQILKNRKRYWLTHLVLCWKVWFRKDEQKNMMHLAKVPSCVMSSNRRKGNWVLSKNNWSWEYFKESVLCCTHLHWLDIFCFHGLQYVCWLISNIIKASGIEVVFFVHWKFVVNIACFQFPCIQDSQSHLFYPFLP